MFKLKEVTRASWLIINEDKEDNQNVGLLSLNNNEEYFMLHNKQKITFRSKAEVEQHLGNNIFNSIIENIKAASADQNFVDGFPVSLPNLQGISNHPSGLPTYTKTSKSDTIYCAGYYCIKYTNGGWLQSYCPKLATLELYGYEGPYSIESEMRVNLARLKKEWKKEHSA